MDHLRSAEPKPAVDMPARIPPVRRRVPLAIRPFEHNAQSLQRLAAGYRLNFYGSGTQALASALGQASRARGVRPLLEVVLPAYGCPDLIAASEHAGLRVRLVDVRPDQWGYDEAALRPALSENTAAIVGVNLLGAGDQHGFLRPIADACGCHLVQDSAQYLPDVSMPMWSGDSVVFSFGRGKPLNLLHGGALLSRASSPPPPSHSDRVPLRSRILASPAAALAFNVATHRQVYPLVSRLPSLNIGETTYKPLMTCQPLGNAFRARVASALRKYQGVQNYPCGLWQEALAEWEESGIRLLGCDGHLKADTQYLRLPLLAPTARMRDTILARLTAAGLGASAMYRVPLDRIRGIPDSVRRQGPFPGAEALASRLFTLPTHDGVDPSVIEHTRREVRAATRST